MFGLFKLIEYLLSFIHYMDWTKKKNLEYLINYKNKNRKHRFYILNEKTGSHLCFVEKVK